MSAPGSPPSAAAHHIQRILWLAMILSVGMYFAVAQFVQSPSTQDNPTLVTTLLVVAVTLVASSFQVRKQLLARSRNGGGPQAALTAHIVALALCESAAVFGLVVYFVTGSPRYSWFLVLGLAGLLLHYPRPER